MSPREGGQQQIRYVRKFWTDFLPRFFVCLHIELLLSLLQDPLVDIRGTIMKLRSDIMEMDLRTGIASEAAWRRQAAASSDRRKKGASALEESGDEGDDEACSTTSR